MVTDSFVGKRFGRLVVAARAPNDRQGKAMWVCHCDCGGEKTIRGYDLTGGRVKSCRCFHRELVLSHGLSRTREYRVWIDMIRRCENPKNKSYANYGGRGITVCERWRLFEHFIADMGSRPSSKHQIDRKNNDLGYEPNNCQWATTKQQARNKRKTIFVILNGEQLSLADACDRTGVKYSTAQGRHYLGMTDAEILAPVGAR